MLGWPASCGKWCFISSAHLCFNQMDRRHYLKACGLRNTTEKGDLCVCLYTQSCERMNSGRVNHKVMLAFKTFKRCNLRFCRILRYKYCLWRTENNYLSTPSQSGSFINTVDAFAQKIMNAWLLSLRVNDWFNKKCDSLSRFVINAWLIDSVCVDIHSMCTSLGTS